MCAFYEGEIERFMCFMRSTQGIPNTMYISNGKAIAACVSFFLFHKLNAIENVACEFSPHSY